MDLPLVMEVLAPNENVSPDMSSYEAMIANWRGSSVAPSRESVEAKWDEIKGAQDAILIDQARKLEYEKLGASTDALAEAAFDKLAGDSVEFDRLQAIREQVKTDIPKQ